MSNFDKNREVLLANYHAIGTDVMTLPIVEFERLQTAILSIKRVCEQSENNDLRYIKRIIDELEGE